MLPTVKEQILGEAEDVLEEAFTGATLAAKALVRWVNQMQNGVKQESEPIEGEQHGG